MTKLIIVYRTDKHRTRKQKQTNLYIADNIAKISELDQIKATPKRIKRDAREDHKCLREISSDLKRP